MYDFKKIEEESREFWKKINLLKLLEEKNKKGKNYFLLDGPPYANDVPHVGHIRNTVYKDLSIRLAFQKGYNVLFQPGFDTHGLPVENKVEKKLNIKDKKEISEMGIKKFTDLCKASAADNKDLWLEVYDKLGSWYSWKEPYLTYDNNYLESAWWTFKEIWNKGLVYEGKKSILWCSHCQTALSGYEVTDSYANLKDPYVIVKFKVKNAKNDYLLVFTTTPWTLISNVAVAANPKEDYVKVETSQGNLILAKKRLEVLEEAEVKYKIIQEFEGKKLENLEYESLIDVPVQQELKKNPKALKVIMSIPILKERVPAKLRTKKGATGEDVFEDFATVTEGTGLVHTAPGHGKTDNEIGKYYNLPEPSPLDDACKYTDEAGQFKGMFVKDADNDILDLLEKTGKLFFKDKIEHKYPLCWRCKTPLIFRMSNQWFIKINTIKDKMIEDNKKVKWYPDFARERFDNWILNADDWNISRQRYWGTPMPIWKCSCGEIKVIGSLEELEKNAINKIPKNFDLHTASEITLRCKCKKEMKRIIDIFDVWFDSGVAPWAPLHYPFENKKLFEEHFPVSRINESQDQIRGWFYHLMFCGTATFDKAPYLEVSMPGWVVDNKGEKMSKSVGNVVYAKDAIENVGADNLRFYYMLDIAPYELQMFNVEVIKKEVWKVFNILINVNTYLLTQTNKVTKLKDLEIEDKWIISKLNSLIKAYNEDIGNFEYHYVGRNLSDFIVNNVSREYIQFIRERVDKNDERVFNVLFEILSKYVVLLAPISPHISEFIYQKLKEKFKIEEKSVHLFNLPKVDEDKIDSDIEESMEDAKKIIQEILAQREKVQLGIRWPLLSAEIKTENTKGIKELDEVIKRKTNIKKLDIKKGEFSVKLDTKLTKELEQEGYAREIMRAIQDLRKKEKLEKKDRIELYIDSNYDLSRFADEIKDKVGAESLEFKEHKGQHSSKEKIKNQEFNVSFNLLK
ncbi:isoleucine--tRNA ligase [Candidatus Woesearchaeota archaeon]|nr:isoleucine--tRNA ligase [Candidatus Woesearchaeota archaeon]